MGAWSRFVVEICIMWRIESCNATEGIPYQRNAWAKNNFFGTAQNFKIKFKKLPNLSIGCEFLIIIFDCLTVVK
jgi:hypothetical protein